LSDAESAIELCANSFNKENYAECFKTADDYLWKTEERFNEKIFVLMYYRGISLDKFGERENYNEALRSFATLLEKHIRSPETFDKLKIEHVRKKCSKYYYLDSKIDEMSCRAAYCSGLSHYLLKDYEGAIYFFERYLNIIQLVGKMSEREHLEYTTIKTLHYNGLSHMNLEQHVEAINSFLSEIKQIEVGHYATGSYLALFNTGLNYLILEKKYDALYYFSESLFHLNAQPVRSLEKFDLDLITINLDDIEYEEYDTLRHIAIVYGLIGKYDKAISLYTKLQRNSITI
jgi:tetratricopeptide (TPR) repeat protein